MSDKDRIIKFVGSIGFCHLFKMFEIHKKHFSKMTFDEFHVLLRELKEEKRLVRLQNANGLTYWELVK